MQSRFVEHEAEAMVERLAGVLQYAVAAGQRPSVRLEEELAMLRDYLSIEQARYGPKLRARVEVGPELYDQPLPPMLLDLLDVQPCPFRSLHNQC